MNTLSKLPEIKKEAFKEARESLGFSVKDLSGMACLSVRQIEQIENGESSSFYSPQIKVTAAKKVAALLKLNEQESFEFSEAIAATKKVSEVVDAQTHPASEEKKSTSVNTVDVSVPEQKKALSKLTPDSDVVHASLKQSVMGSSQKKSPKKLVWILGLALVLAFSIVNLRTLFFSEPAKDEATLVEGASVNPPLEATAETKTDIPVASAATPEPAVAPAQASVPVAAVATAVFAECPSADAVVVNYKTDAPKKAGDMVYFQSKTAQTVCVVDASGKIQNKALEPGVGISIYGKPPFKVLTSGQAQVDMYYQGAKVRVANTNAKTIMLEAAEVVQPAAPLDSQPR